LPRPRSRSSSRSGLLGSLTLLLRRRDHRLAKLFVAGAIVVLGVVAWSVWPYWQLSEQFESLPSVQPSRLYGAAFELVPGRAVAARELARRLDDAAAESATLVAELPELAGPFGRLQKRLRSAAPPAPRLLASG